MLRLTARAALFAVFVMLLGCAVGRPKIPGVINPPSVAYTTADLEKHRCLYEEALTGKDCTSRSAGKTQDDAMARYWRDTMINLVRRDIESYYREYEVRLADNRRRFTSVIDVASLAGVTAATVTNGARAKTVISTMVAFLQGAHGKIDENIFRDRTTDVVIQKMRAGRARVETGILEKMTKLNARQYVFSEAEKDLRELFWAGTLQSGFIELALDAGNDAAQARAEKSEVESARLPTVTSEQLQLSTRINREITRLEKDLLGDSVDAARAAEEKARAALTKLGTSIPAGAREEDILRLLRKEASKALFALPDDTIKLMKLAQALGLEQ